MRLFAFGFLLAIAIQTAAWGGPAEELAIKRAGSEKVLAAIPAPAQALWENLGDGDLQHKPSGLVCPYYVLPRAPLTQILVQETPPPALNALCVYGSDDGLYSQSLTATKVREGTSTELILQNMRAKLAQQFPEMKSLGTRPHFFIGGAIGEVFTTIENGKPYTEILYVAVVKDWAVWSLSGMPDEKQNHISIMIADATVGALFYVGVSGVMRAVQGIPEPRFKQ